MPNCAICGKETNFEWTLPMYQGVVVDPDITDEWAGQFVFCGDCFKKYTKQIDDSKKRQMETRAKNHKMFMERVRRRDPHTERLMDMRTIITRLDSLTQEWFLEACNRPTIVCLCGSTRFYEAFQEANFRQTLEGKIVLSVGFFMHRPEALRVHGETVGITPEQKQQLDELHLRKIDLADEVLVINVGGYIGKSTDNEIRYAIRRKKTILWLEEPTEETWLRYYPENASLAIGRDPEEHKKWETRLNQ